MIFFLIRKKCTTRALFITKNSLRTVRGSWWIYFLTVSSCLSKPVCLNMASIYSLIQMKSRFFSEMSLCSVPSWECDSQDTGFNFYGCWMKPDMSSPENNMPAWRSRLATACRGCALKKTSRLPRRTLYF